MLLLTGLQTLVPKFQGHTDGSRLVMAAFIAVIKVGCAYHSTIWVGGHGGRFAMGVFVLGPHLGSLHPASPLFCLFFLFS